ncbi:MAG: hypothetical protein DME25_05955 [Verrucomicrobia bacterium]|nr:MAG: hypothetical protein DME25_05955 [Verrucomicrobiota bacterium]
MARLIFRTEAKLEFFEAVARYEGEEPGLGREFAKEVVHALGRARRQPELYRRVRGRARKTRVKRFKAYNIYFAIKEDAFSIISIFHSSRNPRELQRRLR